MFYGLRWAVFTIDNTELPTTMNAVIVKSSTNHIERLYQTVKASVKCFKSETKISNQEVTKTELTLEEDRRRNNYLRIRKRIMRSTKWRDEVTTLVTLLVLVSQCSLSQGQLFARPLHWGPRPEVEIKPQPDDVMLGGYDEMKSDDGWLCTRECKPNDPRICYYTWLLEPYTTMNRACGNCPNVTSDCHKPQCNSADGFERAIITVNRMLPGPSIQVCKGDTVVVDITNNLPGRSTSIHWHGPHQKGTPWMDGVPYITQCPIQEAATFRYRFRATEAGTSMWHSHDGLQKVDGVVGSLIVRLPDSENPVRDLYDFDLPSHVVLIEDWLHTTADERFPGYFRYKLRGQEPASYLINGKGVQVVNKKVLVGKTPLAEFKVRKGYRYRFRFIGASCLSCPYRVTIQNHKLLAIATDRNLVEPVLFDSFIISAGERYDGVIEAMAPVGAYYIFVEGLGNCSPFSQVAVLRYEGGPSRPSESLSRAFPDTASGYVLNAYKVACNDSSLGVGRCINQMRAIVPTPPEVLKPEPDQRILLTFDFYNYPEDNKELFYSGNYPGYFVAPAGNHVAGQMNNMTFARPSSPLLTQFHDVPSRLFCENSDCPNGKACACAQVFRVPLNSVVEFMMVHTEPPKESMLFHPFHLHGTVFYVVEEGLLPKTYHTPEAQEFVEQKRNEKRHNLSTNLPMKDTVSVPTQGYAILRIKADNPGFWFFHCHFAYHQEAGMAVVLWVGELEDVPPPPVGFPTCSDFTQPMELLPDPDEKPDPIPIHPVPRIIPTVYRG